ncbi:MAG: hypothetical protein ACOC8N_08620 [Spirochaetota bacterium]
MVCVLVSFKKEISGLLALLDQVRRQGKERVYQGRYRGLEVRVVCTGMGGGSLPGELLAGCTLVVSMGFCGALRGDLAPGDLVVSREVTCVTAGQLDRLAAGTAGPAQRFPIRRVDGAEEAAALLRERLPEGPPVHLGRTVTAGRVARDRNEKERLGSYFQALAVDMEDFYRLQAAAARGAAAPSRGTASRYSTAERGAGPAVGIPCLCVRAVLDRVEDRVPDLRGGLREGLLLPARLAALKRGMDRACAGITASAAALVDHYG